MLNKSCLKLAMRVLFCHQSCSVQSFGGHLSSLIPYLPKSALTALTAPGLEETPTFTEMVVVWSVDVTATWLMSTTAWLHWPPATRLHYQQDTQHLRVLQLLLRYDSRRHFTDYGKMCGECRKSFLIDQKISFLMRWMYCWLSEHGML